jgi:leader peptidase (prepilin peptidase) / N-methyltransferase
MTVMGSHDAAIVSVVVLGAAMVGLVVGSFLNVVVYRVPLGLSVSRPRSFCPACRRQLTWWENIPVASWVLLRGRCHGCGLPISFRYPAVELVTGVAFAWVTWEWHASLIAAGYCCLAASLITVLLIEGGGHRAPLAMAGIGTGIALVFFAIAAIWTGDWRALVGPLAGTALGGAGFKVLRHFDPTAGDRRDLGRSALVLAGCWLGGLSAAALVTATLVGAASYTLCVLAPWVLSERVRTTSIGATTVLSRSLVAAPMALALATAMCTALVVQG